ncbi:hypothetical protein [Alicyclobacillus sp. SO9]|uniref:hypothetical protein n=1 Tax=Alicyclobacillus sp. SO9 TaxID=2665646 RepID=UPI0018E71693|nr:hypothetical protein [Alicyclobacillus sp. SO9]QQE79444.1 hypothetical protein GI364_02790 [Alicyclobacillus sp. SO9]
MKRILLIGFLAAFVFAAGASMASHFSSYTHASSTAITSVSSTIPEPGTDP